jgi:hypothetical protein
VHNTHPARKVRSYAPTSHDPMREMQCSQDDRQSHLEQMGGSDSGMPTCVAGKIFLYGVLRIAILSLVCVTPRDPELV